MPPLADLAPTFSARMIFDSESASTAPSLRCPHAFLAALEQGCPFHRIIPGFMAQVRPALRIVFLESLTVGDRQAQAEEEVGGSACLKVTRWKPCSCVPWANTHDTDLEPRRADASNPVPSTPLVMTHTRRSRLSPPSFTGRRFQPPFEISAL